MGLFKKMAFWKHDDDLLSESAELPEQDFESKPLPRTPSRFSPISDGGLEPPAQSFPSVPSHMQSQQQSTNLDAELRVISAKLDTVKALLDVMNQRLDRLEGKKDELSRWR